MLILDDSQIRAMIFDLDGSLLDSMWVWSAIDTEYLSRFGISDPGDVQKEIGGCSMYETALYFQRRFGIQDPPEKMMADWNQMAMEEYVRNVYPKKGAEKLLKEGAKRGIAMGIATSNSRELTDAVLRARNLDSYFSAVVTGDEVKKGKPAPDIYLAAAEKLSVSPASCIVFEDIPDGLLAAVRAGMTAVSVEDPASRGQEEEKRRFSSAMIRDFSEVVYEDS